MKTTDELLNGCEHDGSYIPVSEVKRLMEQYAIQFTRPTVSEDHYRKAVEWIDGMITCPKNVADFKTRAYRIAKIAAGKELNR